MAQTLTFNDSDVEVQIDTSAAGTDLRITGPEGQQIVNAVRRLREQIPTLKRVQWDIPGGGTVGRLGVWADSTPRIVYLNFSNLTLPSPDFKYQFFNGAWTDAEIGYLDKLKDAFLTFNSSHTLTAAVGQSADADPVWNGLIHYWPLGESSGTRFDSYATGHLSESLGTVDSVTGKRGNAAGFLDADGRLLATPIPDMNQTGDWTITFWIYATTFDAGEIFGIYEGTPSLLSRCEISGAGVLSISQNDGAVKTATCSGPITTSAWWFFTCKYNSAWTELSISGMPADGGSNVGGSNGSTGFQLGGGPPIGFVVDTGQNFTAVSIDEIAVWNRAISTTEQLNLFNGGVGRFF